MTLSTCGLGGFGLLIAPVCPCRAVVTDRNELVIDHGDGDGDVARITPGDHPAGAPLAWHKERVGHFGEGGPILSLADRFELDDVFERIDVGLGDAPWCALGPGFVVDLPRGLVLIAADPDDADPMFELHLPTGNNELIRFVARPVAASAVEIQPAAHQELVAQDRWTVEDGEGHARELRVTELAYTHREARWRQLAIPIPLDQETSIVIFAQAREDHAPSLFQAARTVAATLGPLGE